MQVTSPVRLSLVIGLAMLPLVIAGCSESGSPTSALAAIESDRAAGVAEAEELVVLVQVSPATLAIGCPGDCVTVHAEIPYADVDLATVALEGIAPYETKPDNRGDLVAKFTRASIEAIVAPPEATLTLTGVTLAGDTFTGSDTIVVRIAVAAQSSSLAQ